MNIYTKLFSTSISSSYYYINQILLCYKNSKQYICITYTHIYSIKTTETEKHRKVPKQISSLSMVEPLPATATPEQINRYDKLKTQYESILDGNYAKKERERLDTEIKEKTKRYADLASNEQAAKAKSDECAERITKRGGDVRKVLENNINPIADFVTNIMLLPQQVRQHYTITEDSTVKDCLACSDDLYKKFLPFSNDLTRRHKRMKDPHDLQAETMADLYDLGAEDPLRPSFTAYPIFQHFEWKLDNLREYIKNLNELAVSTRDIVERTGYQQMHSVVKTVMDDVTKNDIKIPLQYYSVNDNKALLKSVRDIRHIINTYVQTTYGYSLASEEQKFLKKDMAVLPVEIYDLLHKAGDINEKTVSAQPSNEQLAYYYLRTIGVEQAIQQADGGPHVGIEYTRGVAQDDAKSSSKRTNVTRVRGNRGGQRPPNGRSVVLPKMPGESMVSTGLIQQPVAIGNW